jgi:hypothetical protein
MSARPRVRTTAGSARRMISGRTIQFTTVKTRAAMKRTQKSSP